MRRDVLITRLQNVSLALGFVEDVEDLPEVKKELDQVVKELTNEEEDDHEV